MSGEDRFEIGLAGPADEPEIRALVASVPMPGAVAFRFAREPDYFLGCSIMGDLCDVLIARHLPDGALAGVACRTERRAFVNGEERVIGGIGGIRVAEQFRGRWLAHLAIRFFRSLEGTDLLHVGVMARDNPRAHGALVGTRPPGGATVRRLAGMETVAIVLHRDLPWARADGRARGVEQGSEALLDEIVAFLRRSGPRRQLFPAYRADDFLGGRLLRGLALEEISVVRRAGRVAGVMAAWDQGAYKQEIVDTYGPTLGRVRPLYDAAARAIGAQPLPTPGEPFRSAFAALVCVEDDDPVLMERLLRATAQRAREQGMAFLTIGLTDPDPLLPVAKRPLHVSYRSDLVAFSWSTHDPTLGLDDRVPYVEIATL